MLLYLALACLLCVTWAPPVAAQVEYPDYWAIHYSGMTCDNTLGNFVYKTRADSPEHCGLKCQQFPQCNFFAQGDYCWLFQRCVVTFATGDTSLVSYMLDIDKGVKETCGSEALLENQGGNAENPTDCSQRCMDNPQCLYFSYNMRTKSCQEFKSCFVRTTNEWSIVVQIRDEAEDDGSWDDGNGGDTDGGNSGNNGLDKNTGQVSINVVNTQDQPIPFTRLNFYSNDQLVLQGLCDANGTMTPLLPAGLITIEVELPSGYSYVGSTPVMQLQVQGGVQQATTIMVDAKQGSSGGGGTTMKAVLTVRAFRDSNKNQIKDSNEKSLPDLPVTVTSVADGTVIGRGITKADGTVTFTDVSPGEYKVSVDTTGQYGYDVGLIEGVVAVSGNAAKLAVNIAVQV